MRTTSSERAAIDERLTGLVLPGGVRFAGGGGEPLRRLSGGIEAVDGLLGGGWPQGRVGEIVGPVSCGKTSLVVALLAAATRRGEVVACVDVADALTPASVAAAGADLGRVLWVRPPSLVEGVRCTELLVQAGGFSLVVFDIGLRLPRGVRGHVWPRLLHGAERSHTALVVLGSCRVAGSFAALGVQVRARAVCWQRGMWPLFDGFEATLCVARSKLGASGGSVEFRVGHWGSPSPRSSPAAPLLPPLRGKVGMGGA